MRKLSLKHRLLLWLLGYVAALSLTLFFGGMAVNEYAERLVWKSLLETEMDYYLQRAAHDPGYRWKDTDTLRLFALDGEHGVPSILENMAPGLHDDVPVEGVLCVVLIDDTPRGRIALAMDITEFEGFEETIVQKMLLGAGASVLILGAVFAWGLGRAVKPLSDLSAGIEALQPDRKGQALVLDRHASSELVVIADALNDYLRRNERFVERERAFIDSASHELRTPIAVIAGATDLALGQAGLGAAARTQMMRVKRTAQDIEQLIGLLLVLAKDPSRLAGISDYVPLDQLLPEIVEDHRYLTRDKALILSLDARPACGIVAPMAIVQAAIGNLLRNAIENSDRGEIRIRLEAPAKVVIEDPGHGMSPEEISAIYTRLARGEGRGGGGIGLELISRLCNHLGWALDISSRTEGGTRTTLDFTPGA
jgi:signal transduction histidine kinase